MTGLPDLNYPAFNAAEEALTAAGHAVLNPARNGGAHFQAVMARQRHERVVLIAAWREGRL